MLGAMRVAPHRVLTYASKQPEEQRRRWAFFNGLKGAVALRVIAATNVCKIFKNAEAKQVVMQSGG